MSVTIKTVIEFLRAIEYQDLIVQTIEDLVGRIIQSCSDPEEVSFLENEFFVFLEEKGYVEDEAIAYLDRLSPGEQNDLVAEFADYLEENYTDE